MGTGQMDKEKRGKFQEGKTGLRTPSPHRRKNPEKAALICIDPEHTG